MGRKKCLHFWNIKWEESFQNSVEGHNGKCGEKGFYIALAAGMVPLVGVLCHAPKNVRFNS